FPSGLPPKKCVLGGTPCFVFLSLQYQKKFAIFFFVKKKERPLFLLREKTKNNIFFSSGGKKVKEVGVWGTGALNTSRHIN
ncbi:hypothetical protein ACNITL_27110, partial [Escherichia coli]